MDININVNVNVSFGFINKTDNQKILLKKLKENEDDLKKISEWLSYYMTLFGYPSDDVIKYIKGLGIFINRLGVGYPSSDGYYYYIRIQ